MANAITGNPIVIDTAASTVIVSTQFRVQAIFWDNTAPANADVLTIKDKLGVVKWNQTIATGNLAPIFAQFPDGVLFDGLIVSAMTRGKVYIYTVNANNLNA